MKQISLDYAAATPLDTRVLKEMQPYLTERFSNPSALYAAGREQRTVLERARKDVAKVLGAKPAEILFTSGSTEGINLAIQGIANQYPHMRIVATTLEHEAVLDGLTRYQRQGRPVGVITVAESGVVDLAHIEAAVNDITVLVCVQYANNEIGTIQPISKIGGLVQSIRADRRARGITTPLYLFCDAAQAGLMSLQVSRLGVDLMSLGGNKLYGPHGVGALYVRTGVELQPLWFGGGQESGMRGGSENVAGAVGFGRALELMQSDRVKESKRLSELRDWLWKELKKNIEGVAINGTLSPRLPGNLNITVEGADGEQMVSHFDKEGFAVATGSACTASNQKPSHVLLAVGRSREQAQSSLRLSLGSSTTKKQLEAFVRTAKKVVPRVRQLTKLS
jgi:cysteine desulfurase